MGRFRPRLLPVAALIVGLGIVVGGVMAALSMGAPCAQTRTCAVRQALHRLNQKLAREPRTSPSALRGDVVAATREEAAAVEALAHFSPTSPQGAVAAAEVKDLTGYMIGAAREAATMMATLKVLERTDGLTAPQIERVARAVHLTLGRPWTPSMVRAFQAAATGVAGP